MLSSLFLLLACFSQTIDWSAQFKSDPSQTKTLLAELEDPRERFLIVEKLGKEFPGQTGELCSLLNSQEAEYCRERNLRPHLWSKPKEPRQSSILSEKTVTTDCSDQLCIQKLAETAARQQDSQSAKSICLSITEEKWQSECIFATAEALVKGKQSKGYALAVELCNHSSSFQDNCQQHLIQQLAKGAPDADTRSEWKTIFSAQNAIESAWSWKDKKKMEALQERLWAEALGISYAGVSTITGNPLDIVPPRYHTHVRAAAAYRLFQLEESTQHSLSTWVDILQQKLSARSQRTEKTNQQRKFLAAPNFGANELQSDESILYLATSRRLFSTDSAEDIAICLLEAEIRKPPVNKTLLEEGRLHPSKTVQETAIRLLATLEE